MAKNDPELRIHKDWLGLLQPVGLVVSPPALVKAQAVPSQNVAELQQKFLSVVESYPDLALGGDDEPFIGDLLSVFRTVLGWSEEDVAGAAGGPPIQDGLELVLPDYNETLRPTYAVVDSMGDGGPLMLVQVLPRSTPLDEAPDEERRMGWSASPQVKLERLLREVKIPVGLLCNGDALRLVYAPSGESSGHLTFPVAAMCEVGGRPILAAWHMLLSEHRVFSAPDGRRITDILSESRKYQAEVSIALSDQVLGALWELLRGFQASDNEDGRRNFNQTAREAPDHVYGGLLTLLMRLIFVLYAEDEGLMPEGEVYANNYSVSGLYNRLSSDAGRYPDTMDQRYGAYAWLLSLFRLVFDGGGHGGLRLPTRHGQLFNPDEFGFLEGRPQGIGRVMGEKFEAPRVSDGCIYRVLDALLVLSGDRLSYRALDVEQVGSVYEAMMGFEVERALGRSIAVRPKNIVIDVDNLLKADAKKRVKWLKGQADSDVTGASAAALKEATTPDEVVAALGRRVSTRSLDATGTPRLMAPGTLYLQPGEERRRSGSHYTPRELTEPIVRTTLRPVLEGLGDRPTPEAILDLKVCDPAMGSGAFLVEACRQLSEALVNAWNVHDLMPLIPPDEEPLLCARRLVAQRCLYGVDKNPFAVNLAKLSIWLVTLAKDHAFTFVDHALTHGDSLVGLTKKQIAAFNWDSDKGKATDLFEGKLKKDIEEALGWRDTLQGIEEGDYYQKKEAWWEAENALADARMIGDLVVATFFGADKGKGREELRNKYRSKVEAWRTNGTNRSELMGIVEELRGGEYPVPPLHWEIEFPEVFGRENPGFDAFVGNPPFLGGARIWPSLGPSYPDWIREIHSDTRGRAVDLIAHFFRRSFSLLRMDGCLGLVATNSVAQGDTREAGLQQICAQGGHIFAAIRRLKWPGSAAVVVSVVFVINGRRPGQCKLNDRTVSGLNSFLFPSLIDFDPQKLAANREGCFQGACVLGMGFTFDDRGSEGLASSHEDMKALVIQDPRNSERIFPYIGGKEINTDPRHAHRRYVIDFTGLNLQEAGSWPMLVDLLRERVKPARDTMGGYSVAERRRENWWQFGTVTPALNRAKNQLDRVLVIARISNAFAPVLLPSNMVFNEKTLVFPSSTFAAFANIQCRLHEVWARFFGSTLKDDFQYTPSDCFERFPFPENWQTNPNLEATGKGYYEFRANLMVRNDEGLTRTYNRFHDPDNYEPDILKLRELHAVMDRAMLGAYGWNDISTKCEFLLDYEIDEDTWGNKSKPYRYRWPEDVHDEVLARLLDLNKKRYEEEVAAGFHDKKVKKRIAKKKESRKTSPASTNLTLPLYSDSLKSTEEK